MRKIDRSAKGIEKLTVTIILLALCASLLFLISQTNTPAGGVLRNVASVAGVELAEKTVLATGNEIKLTENEALFVQKVLNLKKIPTHKIVVATQKYSENGEVYSETGKITEERTEVTYYEFIKEGKKMKIVGRNIVDDKRFTPTLSSYHARKTDIWTQGDTSFIYRAVNTSYDRSSTERPVLTIDFIQREGKISFVVNSNQLSFSDGEIGMTNVLYVDYLSIFNTLSSLSKNKFSDTNFTLSNFNKGEQLVYSLISSRGNIYDVENGIVTIRNFNTDELVQIFGFDNTDEIEGIKYYLDQGINEDTILKKQVRSGSFSSVLAGTASTTQSEIHFESTDYYKVEGEKYLYIGRKNVLVTDRSNQKETLEIWFSRNDSLVYMITSFQPVQEDIVGEKTKMIILKGSSFENHVEIYDSRLISSELALTDFTPSIVKMVLEGRNKIKPKELPTILEHITLTDKPNYILTGENNLERFYCEHISGKTGPANCKKIK